MYLNFIDLYDIYACHKKFGKMQFIQTKCVYSVIFTRFFLEALKK